MSEPLSPEQMAEIEARAAAATPGPWCTDSWEIYQGTEYVPGISQWIGETCRGTSTPEQDCADAAFVAAARTDVPALLAEIDRLRAELAKSRAEVLREAAAALESDMDRFFAVWVDEPRNSPYALGHKDASDELRHMASSGTAAGDKQPEPQTRQCGHDDYHSPHAWADQPRIWCPGHTFEGGA